MTKQILHVEGMTCGHCVETVTKAVSALDGVERVDVNLEKKEVTVDFDEGRTRVQDIQAKINEAGYEVLDS